ncbi:hypothetical protein [Actinophytocola sp.]|uniref:hypothetical protein n=1 Tax=Actinophytocola sp. TaxID=1872138 RepID=UPI003899F684
MSAGDGLVVGRGVPAFLLRVVILVVGGAIVLVPLREGATVGTLLILLPAVLASAYAPASPAPAGVVVTAAVLVAVVDGAPLRAEVLVLVPLVHLFHITCGIAGAMPAAGQVHLRALRAPALRFLLVQAVMAALVLLVGVLPAGRNSPLVEAVALVGLAGVAGVIVWLQRVK